MSDYTPDMAHAAAEHGAKWLDERCPDWIGRIDLATLELNNPRCCVLAQTADCLVPAEAVAEVRPSYYDVVWFLGVAIEGRWVCEHGFNVPGLHEVQTPIHYEMLTIAWRELISQRLELVA